MKLIQSFVKPLETMLASTHVTTVNSIALEFFILLFGMTFTRQFGVLAREAGLFSQAVLLRAVESQHAGGICPTGLAKPYARLLRHCFGQQRRQGFYREWPACAAGRFHRGAARLSGNGWVEGVVSELGAVLAEEPPHTANGRALEIWRRPLRGSLPSCCWADLGPGSAKHLWAKGVRKNTCTMPSAVGERACRRNCRRWGVEGLSRWGSRARVAVLRARFMKWDNGRHRFVAPCGEKNECAGCVLSKLYLSIVLQELIEVPTYLPFRYEWGCCIWRASYFSTTAMPRRAHWGTHSQCMYPCWGI